MTTDQNTVVPPLDTPDKGFFHRVRLNRRYLPYLWIATIGLGVTGVLGYVAFNAVINKGFMPPPSGLLRYDCVGTNPALTIFFRHGIENFKVQSGTAMYEGSVHNWQVHWAELSSEAAIADVSLPTEITFEDARSIRIKGVGRSQLNCILEPKQPSPP